MFVMRIIFYLSIIIVLSSNCSKKVEDCRKTNSCPVSFLNSTYSSLEDENGETVEQPKILPDQGKVLILLDTNGNVQHNRGKYSSIMIKVLFGDLEVFVPSYSITYSSSIRTLAKPALPVYDSPNNGAKVVGMIPFNTVVQVVDQNASFEEKNAKIKISDNIRNISGWTKRTSLTDSDYDANLHSKNISDLMMGYKITASNDDKNIKLVWGNEDISSAECRIGGDECFVDSEIGTASFGKSEPALYLFVRKNTATNADLKCEIRRIDFIDAHTNKENGILDPYMSCDEVEVEVESGEPYD
ncbi:hypothetical protein P3G55_00550 [Leptospira sp. 96542]|nr:hypothetical protein [Leptospira sp. 96542]